MKAEFWTLQICNTNAPQSAQNVLTLNRNSTSSALSSVL